MITGRPAAGVPAGTAPRLPAAASFVIEVPSLAFYAG